VAVVDDDEDVRRALGRLLRSMGHAVQLFASAEEFEAQVTAIDCAVVDVRLPGASGLELRDRLRGKAPPTPVVLISGDPDPTAADPVRAMDTPSISKPFDDIILMAAIADAMSVEPRASGSHA
jgi:FixJ family two-component response regulator